MVKYMFKMPHPGLDAEGIAKVTFANTARRWRIGAVHGHFRSRSPSISDKTQIAGTGDRFCGIAFARLRAGDGISHTWSSVRFHLAGIARSFCGSAGALLTPRFSDF